MAAFLLFVLSLLMTIARSQEFTTTTSNNTYDCSCQTYTPNNLTKSDGSGCISGDDICATCNGDTEVCTCFQGPGCEIIHDIVEILAVAVIVAIVVSVVFCLCVTAGCVYCWCAGILCCAAAASNKNHNQYKAPLNTV